MQSAKPQVQSAKQRIMELFEDNFGSVKRKPYYLTQVQTIFETKFSDDVTYHALCKLVKEHKLHKFNLDTKYVKKTVFFYNAKLGHPESNPILNTHIKSTGKLIDEYSKPSFSTIYGDYLEGLVACELQRQGFTIVGSHTKEYKNKKYSKNDSNLDFIAEHHSGKLNIGVEVKNTISVLDKKEVETKLDMCNYLGVKPVFAARWIKPYHKLIKNAEGFPWTFNTQLYPPNYKNLAETLSQRLNLPVKTATELPPESLQLFHNWIKNRIC